MYMKHTIVKSKGQWLGFQIYLLLMLQQKVDGVLPRKPRHAGMLMQVAKVECAIIFSECTVIKNINC